MDLNVNVKLIIVKKEIVNEIIHRIQGIQFVSIVNILEI